jgi:hypothetical protein
MDPTRQLLLILLLDVLLPLWLLAGVGDWWCHRREHIEHTAGPREAALHLAMIAELGLGAVAVTLLRVNAAVLTLLFAVCVAHELTTWIDLHYAESRRRIPVPEQWVHSLQVVLPWVALGGIAALHADQALALFGRGPAVADWSWSWRDPLPPPTTIALGALAGLLFVVLPFAEEFVRCRRVARRRERGGARADATGRTG